MGSIQYFMVSTLSKFIYLGLLSHCVHKQHKLIVKNNFLNMTDFDTYLEKISHLCMIAMSENDP